MIIDEDKPLSPASFRDPVSVPDYSMPRSNSYVERRNPPANEDQYEDIYTGFRPYIIRLVEPDDPELDPSDQITLTTGYLITPVIEDSDLRVVPLLDGSALDSEPKPSVLLATGSYVAYLITESSEIQILPSGDPIPDAGEGYVFTLCSFDLLMTSGRALLSNVQHYISNDIELWPDGGAATEDLYPWKLRIVGGNWQVYGTGATIEERWSGDTYTVNGLDSNLTLSESFNYIYLRASVSYGVIDEFDITVESFALQRVVSVDGEQTELNIIIGTIVGSTATQRLRDPLNLTLTCVAGVPAWVNLLSEGVAP